MRAYLKLFVFLLVSSASLAQQSLLDSLRLAARSEKTDSQQVKNFMGLAKIYFAMKSDSSVYFGERAVSLAERLSKKQKASVYRFAGQLFSFRSEYRKALDYYQKSLEMCLGSGGKIETGEAYHQVGNLLLYLGEYNTAMSNYLKALEYYESAGAKKLTVNAYAGIALVQLRQRRFDEAIRTFEKNLKLYRMLGDSDGVVTTLRNEGVAYSEQMRYTEALERYFQCLRIAESAKVADPDLPGLFNNIASSLQDLGRWEEALVYWKKSLAICEQGSDNFTKVYCLKGLGGCYRIKGDLTNASKYLQQAADLAETSDLRFELMDICGQLAECYGLQKLYKKAFEYSEKRSMLKDSVISEENTRLSSEMQNRYESEKKDKELIKKQALLEQQQLENRRKAAQRNVFIIAAVLLFFTAFYIYRSYRLKQVSLLETSRQKKVIEQKNKDITDSIRYAKRIQDAVLPAENFPAGYFTDSFILYLPKDVISGDFYWYTRKNGITVVTAADCTGHGIPGALMSVMGLSFLNEVVTDKSITAPDIVLGELRDRIKAALKQTGESGESRDGMDMALLAFSPDNSSVEYSGANNPLWVVQRTSAGLQLNVIPPDRRPVGYFLGKSLPFTKKTVSLSSGDTLYLFSDGYADQFGGAHEKKYKYSRLKDFLLSVNGMDMNSQKAALIREFNSWKGNLEQIDDVCIIGIRV